MTAPTLPVADTTPDLVDSAFCHVVCNVHDDRTLCGLTDYHDDECTDDPCNNVCLVCRDLREAVPCPVCGTDCAPAGATT